MPRESVSRRDWLRVMMSAGAAMATLATGRRVGATGVESSVTVYKDPNCGCCKKWISHLETNGFKVVAHDRSDMDALKNSFGVPLALRSCHTAVAGRLVIEGHVPAADVRKAMTRASKSMVGLAVPGMPAGSPGMEMGGSSDRYDVIAFDANGATKVFATHG